MSLKAEIIVVGAIIMALAIYHTGFYVGEKAGRSELWEQQKEAIGLNNGETIRFPNGAVLHSNGRIEWIQKIEQSIATGGQCAICHKSL